MIIPALPLAHRRHCSSPSSSSKRLSRSSIFSVKLKFFFPNEYCCCYHSPPLPELSSSYRSSADPSRPIRVGFCVYLLHTTALRTSETYRNSNPTFNPRTHRWPLVVSSRFGPEFSSRTANRLTARAMLARIDI